MKFQITLILIAVLFFTAPAYGAAHSHPCEEGWTFQDVEAQDWEPTLGQGALSMKDGVLSAFAVANSTAQWTLTAEPAWVYQFPLLKMKYRARGVANGASHPLLRIRPGSIGPVTPGAKNMENPFARAGEATVSPAPDSLLDGEIHELAVSVVPPIQTRQIDQIVLTIQTGDQPAALEIFDLSFHDPHAQGNRIISCQNLIAAASDKLEAAFLSIAPSDLSLDILAASFPQSPEIQCASIPFHLNESKTVAYTRLAQRDSIRLAVNRKCREIFLLLSCYLAGTDGAFSFKPRTEIVQPERLIVIKHYADGSVERSFPFNLNRREYSVTAQTLCAYLIPADPGKELESVAIEEWMPYGQIFLAAATLNSGDAWAQLPPNDFPFSLPAASEASSAPPKLTVENDRKYVIENDIYRVEMNSAAGLCVDSMHYKLGNINILPASSPLFSFSAGGQTLSSNQLDLQSYKVKSDGVEFVLRTKDEAYPLQFTVDVQSGTHPELRLTLQAENLGYAPQSLRLLFPDLRGIRLSGDPAEDYYFFPRSRAAQGRRPIRMMGVHSGEFPLQFFDVYSESLNAGLALHTRDSQSVLKRFRYDKRSDGSWMGVEYGFFAPIALAPKETFQPPTAVLEFHQGDWRAPFRTYKQWLGEWRLPQSKARGALKNVFICRRDYPIGGTGYLFNDRQGAYTLDRLIAESRQALGGVDMIDISGWAYSEQYGRVGEYRRYELGGLENLRAETEKSQTQHIPVGLYLEGYLVDPRSPIGREHDAEWSIVDKEGKPKTWAGNEEMFMDSYLPAWRDFMSETLSQVAQETGAAALYMDEYGFADEGKACYSPNHGHPIGAHPLHGELGMLRQVRQALNRLDRPPALYIEQTPNDVASQYVDAAFSYSMAGGGDFDSPVKLDLFRFAFPDFKVIELFHPGIDPRGASAEDAKLCFFQGKAMWLKGRAKSWYSREFRQFLQQAYRLYHEHEEAFASNDVEPLIPTLQRGLYANRFSSEQEDIVMLYNADYQTIQGDLLSWDRDRREAANLMGIVDFSSLAEGNNVVISGSVGPHGVGCVQWIKRNRE
ncbi:MAG: DUF6259 domain-containing protein [Candidatus Omnitrophota bacterium]